METVIEIYGLLCFAFSEIQKWKKRCSRRRRMGVISIDDQGLMVRVRQCFRKGEVSKTIGLIYSDSENIHIWNKDIRLRVYVTVWVLSWDWNLFAPVSSATIGTTNRKPE
jgi:hypothetical protein